MKRKLGTGLGLVAVILALVLWRCRGRHEAAPATVTATTGSTAVVASSTASTKPRPDPRTMARASIAGTVTDEATKAPLAHARVCVAGDSHDLPAELLREPFCTDTDDKGGYLVGDLLPAEYRVTAGAKTYRPAVFHPGGDHRRATFRLALGEHKTAMDLALRAGGVEVTGTVSDLTGGPIGKARVWATEGGWGTAGGLIATETDEQGAFSLWVAPGRVTLTAAAEGYTSDTDYLHAPGRSELLLTPESTVAGIVIDAASGQPVEGARVNVGRSEWDTELATFTAADGSFHVAHLLPGRVVATARTEHGFGRTEGSTLVGLGQHVDGIVVKLFAAHRISGTVMIGGTKTVCAEPEVSLREETADRWIMLQRQEDGSLAAEGVLPGTYAVNVACEGYQDREKYEPIKLVDKDATGLVWEVDPGASITGKVVTRAGEPVDGAQVYARSTGGNARDKGGWGIDKTQRDGHFDLIGLRPGSYRVEVASERGIGPVDGYKVDVAAGAKVTRDLVLDDAGTIRGTVTDASGKAVGGVRITARGVTGTWNGGENNTSDEAGNFTLDGIRPGDYRVTAQRSWNNQLRKPGTTDDSKQGEKVTVKANAVATVKLLVESQTGSIKGIVVDAEGKPVPDAFMSAVRESDAVGSAATSVAQTRWDWDEKPVITGVDGTFTVEHLSPGMYTVRAYRKGGGEAVAEHVALQTSARLQIKPTGSIEGTARRTGGTLDELTVGIVDRATGFTRRESFYMTSGHFIIRDLPRGHFTLTVSSAGASQDRELDLAEGEVKTGVDVELQALLTLTGRLVDLVSKQPVAGIQMFAMPATGTGGFSIGGGENQDYISDESGRFTLKNAPRGKLMLRGFPRDRESPYAMINLVRTADGTGTVDLGDVPVIKKRVKTGDTVGELGVNFKEQPPAILPDQRKLEVSWIDPAGPAAKTELKVGDVVTTVDGIDVAGANNGNAWTLMRAPPGTKLVFGLARGAAVTVTLATP